VIAQAAFVAHADFPQDSRGGYIAREVRGVDPLQVECVESILQNRGGRFSRVATAPVWNPNPVAEFGVVMRGLDAKAYTTTQLARVAKGDRKTDAEPKIRVCMAAGNEVHRILLVVGMWNSQCGGGHFTRACQSDQVCGIGEGMRAQPETIRLEGGLIHGKENKPILAHECNWTG